MEETYYLMNPWWEGRRPEAGIPRPEYLAQLQTALARRQIELVIGGRRVGKTTLIKQLILRCLDTGVSPQDLLYLALDHPRLVGTRLSEHVRIFRTLFNQERTHKLWLVFDEVQESPDWEAELKALYDLENVKIVCTGSTAALLASQGGKLTGRQSLLTVYPLSFREFLQFRGYAFSRAEGYRYTAAVSEYLETGGYPEQVLHPSEVYLAQLVQDIIARDLVRLGRLRRPELATDLLRLLAAGTGTRTSYQRLSRALGVAVDTVKEYVSHLTHAFLVQTVEKWTPSYTERVYAPRKVYLLDTGIKSLLTGTGDMGAKAETAVFADFLRRGQSCGYFAESEREVDFVSGSPEAPVAVEVKYDSTFDWEDRRYAGIRLFLRRYPVCRHVTIVTRDVSHQVLVGDTTITALPLWQYLLRE